MLEANRAVAELPARARGPAPLPHPRAARAGRHRRAERVPAAPSAFAVDYEGRVEPRDVQRLLERLRRRTAWRACSRARCCARSSRRSTAPRTSATSASPSRSTATSPRRSGAIPTCSCTASSAACSTATLDDGARDAARLEAASVAQLAGRARGHGGRARHARSEEGRVHARPSARARAGDDRLGDSPSASSSSSTPIPIEGLVRADALTDDRYCFIEEERALEGLRTRPALPPRRSVAVEATNVSLRRRADRLRAARTARGGAGEGSRRAPATAGDEERPGRPDATDARPAVAAEGQNGHAPAQALSRGSGYSVSQLLSPDS